MQMFNPRNKILTKKSKGKIIQNDEPISINSALRCNNLRINMIPKKVIKIN